MNTDAYEVCVHMRTYDVNKAFEKTENVFI